MFVFNLVYLITDIWGHILNSLKKLKSKIFFLYFDFPICEMGEKMFFFFFTSSNFLFLKFPARELALNRDGKKGVSG